MKPVLEETIEQITGKNPKVKPQTTSGLKEALDPGKLVADSLRQALGYSSSEEIPTSKQVGAMLSKDEKEKNPEIEKLQGVIANEQLSQPGTSQPQGQKSAQTKPVSQSQSQPKGNIAAIKPSPKPQQPETPSYIRGKPGFNPEKQAQEEKKRKERLPDLPQITTKRPRGSWMQAFERKKHGVEVKGGRE